MEINILLGKVPPKSGAPVGAELAGIRPFRHEKIKKHYMMFQALFSQANGICDYFCSFGPEL